jgi:hypothetical protein
MPLYSERDILERVDGLIEIMYDGIDDQVATYQAHVLKIILLELFADANRRHDAILEIRKSTG